MYKGAGTAVPLIRDYLRRHVEIADAYGRFKQALALVFDDDIAGYRDAKRPVVQAVLAKVRVEEGRASASWEQPWPQPP